MRKCGINSHISTLDITVPYMDLASRRHHDPSKCGEPFLAYKDHGFNPQMPLFILSQ